jgi:hypothetical protein
MNFLEIENLEKTIENLRNSMRQQNEIIESTNVYIGDGYSEECLSVTNLLDRFNDSKIIQFVHSNLDVNSPLYLALNELNKNRDFLENEVKKETANMQFCLDLLQKELTEKNELLQKGIETFLKEANLKLDYSIKVGKPKNPNELNYKKEELDEFISFIVLELCKKNIVSKRGERNKIFLSSSDLPEKEAKQYIYDMIKDCDIVKNKFGGTDFKGVLQSDTIKFKTSKELMKIINL